MTGLGYTLVDGDWNRLRQIIQQLSSLRLTQYIHSNGTIPFIGTGAGFKDEDDMASNSAVAIASQQSIKTFVQNSIAGAKKESHIPFVALAIPKSF